MADNKKMVEAITSMDTDFAQWYTDVCKKADLVDYSKNKGSMIIRPYGYAIWENMVNILDKEFIVSSMLMGVPHTVVFVDDINMEEIHKYGPIIEKHEIFPQNTNVNFVKIIDNKNILVRTWERGCGYTLGCGTGMTASVIISNFLNKVDKSVNVTSEGGSIKISLINDEAYMSGKAQKICEGNLEV